MLANLYRDDPKPLPSPHEEAILPVARLVRDEWMHTVYRGPADTDNLTQETYEKRDEYRSLMLKEPAVSAAFWSRIASVMNLIPKVHAQDPDNPAEVEVANFVKDAIGACQGGWPHIIGSLAAGGLLDGFAVCEMVFDFPERGKWRNKRWVLKEFAPLDGRFIRFDIDSFKRVVGVRGLKANAGQVFNVDRFAIYSHQQLFNNPFGISQFRAAYRAAKMMESAIKLRIILLQNFTGPFVAFKSASPETRASAMRIVANARSQGFLVCDKNDDFTVTNMASGSDSEFQSAMDDLRKEMYTAICWGYLPFVEGREGSELGNSTVQKSITELGTWRLATGIAEVINRYVVAPLVRHNIADETLNFPFVSLGGQNTGDKKAAGDIFEQAKRIGVTLSKKQIQRAMDLEEPNGPEDELREMPTGGMAGAGNPFAGMPMGDDGGMPPDGGAPPDGSPVPDGGVPTPEGDDAAPAAPGQPQAAKPGGAVDLSRWNPRIGKTTQDEMDKAAMIAILDLQARAHRAGSPGRFQKAIDALRSMIGNHPAMHLALAGPPDQSFGWRPEPTRTGGIKAINTENPKYILYGDKAKLALNDHPDQPKVAQESHERYQGVLHAKGRAQELAAKLASLGGGTSAEYKELAGHVGHLTVNEIHAVRTKLMGSFSNARKRGEMVSALSNYALRTAGESVPDVLPGQPSFKAPKATLKPGVGGGTPPPSAPVAPPTPTTNSGSSGRATSILKDHLDASEGLSPEQWDHFHGAIERATAKMPAAAHARIEQNLHGATFHAKSASIGDALYKDCAEQSPDPKHFEDLKGQRIGAGYCRSKGTLHIDGDIRSGAGEDKNPEQYGLRKVEGKKYAAAHEVYAHALGRVIDGPDGHFSDTEEWGQAFQDEIAHSGAQYATHKLSAFASMSPEQGFAEFARLVYGSKVPAKETAERFPQATAFFQKHGLLPGNEAPATLVASAKDAKGAPPKLATVPADAVHPPVHTAPALSEAFDKSVVVAKDGSHVDTLKPLAEEAPKPVEKKSPFGRDELKAKPPVRAFQAGMNRTTAQFDSNMQQRLYNVGSKQRQAMRGEKVKNGGPGLAAEIAMLAAATGRKPGEIRNLSSDVYDDVRKQMKGAKDEEHRVLVDNHDVHGEKAKAVQVANDAPASVLPARTDPKPGEAIPPAPALAETPHAKNDLLDAEMAKPAEAPKATAPDLNDEVFGKTDAKPTAPAFAPGTKETAESVLDRVKASPNQPADRDWDAHAQRHGIAGDFTHVELPTKTLTDNVFGGHLRRSNSVDQNAVDKKVESGERNPVLITKEPGRGSLVVDGNHSLAAAMQAGDPTVQAIVSENSPLHPKEDEPYSPPVGDRLFDLGEAKRLEPHHAAINSTLESAGWRFGDAVSPKGKLEDAHDELRALDDHLSEKADSATAPHQGVHNPFASLLDSHKDVLADIAKGEHDLGDYGTTEDRTGDALSAFKDGIDRGGLHQITNGLAANGHVEDAQWASRHHDKLEGILGKQIEQAVKARHAKAAAEAATPDEHGVSLTPKQREEVEKNGAHKAETDTGDETYVVHPAHLDKAAKLAASLRSYIPAEKQRAEQLRPRTEARKRADSKWQQMERQAASIDEQIAKHRGEIEPEAVAVPDMAKEFDGLPETPKPTPEQVAKRMANVDAAVASRPADAASTPGKPAHPLEITKDNVRGVWEQERDAILKTDRKLSPNAAGSLAAARILNHVGESAQEHKSRIDQDVRQGKPVSDADEERYIHANDARQKLYPELVSLSGYRPMETVDEHPEAMKPISSMDNTPSLSLADRLKERTAGIDPDQVRNGAASQKAKADWHDNRVQKLTEAHEKAKQAVRLAGSRQPEKKNAVKEANKLEKELDKAVQERGDHSNSRDVYTNRLQSLAIDPNQPDFVRLAAASHDHVAVGGNNAAEEITPAVRKHLEANGHDPAMAEAVAQEIVRSPLRGANQLGGIIDGEKTRAQMYAERKQAREHVASLDLPQHHKANAEGEAGGIYAGDIEKFKSKWSGIADQSKAEQQRKQEAEAESNRRMEASKKADVEGEAYIASVKSGRPDANASPDAVQRAIRHVAVQAHEWHEDVQLPAGQSAKQAVNEIAKLSEQNGRWALSKTIAEKGWVSDTKYMMKATPEMVAHAVSIGADKKEGKSLPVDSVLPKKFDEYADAKPIASQVSPLTGLPRVLMQSGDRHMEFEPKYIANIQKHYPDAQWKMGKHSVVAVQNGEVVAMVMPFTANAESEEARPIATGKRLAITDVAEPGPFKAEDVKEIAGKLKVGEGTDMAATLQVMGGRDNQVYLKGAGTDDRMYGSAREAIAAGKEILAHSHGTDEDGNIIFKPKGAGTTELTGEAKTKRDYYAGLREKAKGKLKKSKHTLTLDDGKTAEVDMHHVSDNFGVHKPIPDAAGKSYGYTVTHKPTGLNAGNYDKLDQAVQFAHALDNMPGVDWKSETIKDSKSEGFSDLFSKFRNVKQAFDEDAYHPDMGTFNKGDDAPGASPAIREPQDKPTPGGAEVADAPKATDEERAKAKADFESTFAKQYGNRPATEKAETFVKDAAPPSQPLTDDEAKQAVRMTDTELAAKNAAIENDPNIGRKWGDGHEITGKRADGSYFVKEPGTTGGIRQIYSKDELEDRIADDEKRAASRAEAVKSAEATKAKEASEKAETHNLDGYGEAFSPIVRARIVKTLDTPVSHNGVIKTRRDLVRGLVGDGFVITKAPDGSDRLEHPDGRLNDLKGWSGTGMSFAKHLIAKRGEVAPATAPASEVPPAEAKGQPNWRRQHDAETDPYRKHQVLQAVANSGRKATDADLSGVLDLLDEKATGSHAWQDAWAVAQNPAASPETKARALAMRDEWVAPGRDEAGEPAKAKEPWEMTAAELEDHKESNPDFAAKYEKHYSGNFVLAHSQYIQDAMKSGKSVPLHVRKEASVTVEPWERTKQEHLQHVNQIKNGGGIRMLGGEKGLVGKSLDKGEQAQAIDFHETAIKQALATGKPVPAEVLKDYPDLAAKHGKGTEATQPAAPALHPFAQEQFNDYRPIIEREAASETSPRRQWGKVDSVLHGLNPDAQKALLEHLATVAPEAYEHGRANPPMHLANVMKGMGAAKGDSGKPDDLGGGGVPPSDPSANPSPDSPEPKKPWQMTVKEFAASGLPTNGWIPSEAHKRVVLQAFKDGEPVPDHVADEHAPTVEARESKKLADAHGADFRDRLKSLAGKAGQIHRIESTSADGTLTVVRRQDGPQSFIDHKKGEYVETPGGVKVVAKAGKPYRGRADGMTTGYLQQITLRDPKGKEADEANRAIAAKKAIDHGGESRNQDYPDLKKKQMSEYVAFVNVALGKPDDLGGISHDELERVGLMRQFGGKWQYRMRSDGKWYHANDKDGAAEMAQKAYSTTPPELRVDGIERGKLADKREYEDMHGMYGHLSVPELQKMADDAKGVKGVPPEKEISDGKRRSGAAMANQGSRDAAEFGMKMGRYIDERKKNEGDDLGGASPALKGPTPKPGDTGAGANPTGNAGLPTELTPQVGGEAPQASETPKATLSHEEQEKAFREELIKEKEKWDHRYYTVDGGGRFNDSGRSRTARQKEKRPYKTPASFSSFAHFGSMHGQYLDDLRNGTLTPEKLEQYKERFARGKAGNFAEPPKPATPEQIAAQSREKARDEQRQAEASEKRKAKKEGTARNQEKLAEQGFDTRKIHRDLGDGKSTLPDGRVVSYEIVDDKGEPLSDATPADANWNYRYKVTGTDGTVTNGQLHSSRSKMQESGELRGLLAKKAESKVEAAPTHPDVESSETTPAERTNTGQPVTQHNLKGGEFHVSEMGGRFALQEHGEGDAVTHRGTFDSLDEAVEASKPKAADETPAAPSAPYSLKEHEGVEDRALSGEMNAEQFRAAYKHFRDHEPKLKAELAQQNAPALRKMASDMGGWPRPDDKKADLIDTIYDKMAHHLMPIGGAYDPMAMTHLQFMDSQAAKVTDADLTERAGRVQKARAERAERVKTMMGAIQEPKTYEDFATFAKLRGEHKMTPEQLATWDNLRADKRREGQKAKRLEDAKVTGFTPGESATGNIGIVEGHHKKRNAPTFTVTIEQHLGDNWGAALERAKRLGGSYVNARIAKAYGATPGFQFFDRAKADEFAKVLRGETVDQTATVEQREADRIANRAGSLTEKAAAKVAEGQESLGKERQVNTHRRSEQAASAEAEARSKIAHGRTLERIGQAMDAGELKHLNGVKGVADLHSLNRVLQNAKYARYQTESKENPALRYEEFMAQPHSEDDVRNVTYPYPQIWSDDLRTMAKSFSDEPGLVRVADKLLKAGNAVNDIKFQTSAGGLKVNGGKLLTARNFADSTQAKTFAHFLRDDKGEESGVRVHASYDPRLAQSAEAQGMSRMGPFYTADKGQTWGASPEASVAAAISKGKKLDLMPIPQEKLLTLADPDHIEAMRKAARRLRSHSNRDLKRIGENLHDRLEHHDRLKRADITNGAELRAALREYLPLRASSEKENPVKELERKLVGQKIDGFFPTPRPLIERMLDKADIQPGHAVLEPSAGKGDILDAISERHPEANAEGIEPMSSLRSIIEAKGHKLAGHDVMEHSGEYDRVVMNPPFENGQDAQHVQKAYEMLKPGGRLVAVMSAGPFGRSDKKSAGFREWLDSMDHEADDLPEGSFAGSDAFRKTGVRTKLLTINKPA